MTGAVQVLDSGKSVPGPYTQQSREEWLRKLLAAQTHIRRHGPPDVRDIALITPEELQEIRRIWVIDKHELEDRLPIIYRETTGRDYAGSALDDDLVLGASEMDQLGEVCGGDRLHYELTRELLSMTRQQRGAAKRSGLFGQLEKTFGKHFYDNEADAIARANAVVAERNQRRQDQRSGRVAEEEPALGKDSE